MTVLRLSQLAAGLFLLWAVQASAYLASGDIHLRLGVLSSDGKGQLNRLCVKEWIVENPVSEQWKLSRDPTHDEDSIAGSHAQTSWSCELEAKEKPSAQSITDGACDRIASIISLKASIHRQLEDERTLVVKLNIEPTTHDCELKNSVHSPALLTERLLYFPDDALARIPVAVGKAGPDLLVELESMHVPPRRREGLATIWVITDAPNASVMLDGGEVSSMPEDGTLRLRFVELGLRKVVLKHADGREQIEFVHVKTGRTNMVAFDDAASSGKRDWPFSLTPIGRNSQGFEEFIRVRDEAVMVRVPEGEFLMGNQQAERSPFEHLVYLSTFLVDKTAVTWKQYKRFVASTGVPMPPHVPYWGIHDDHPAVYVTWQEARDYCQWAGARLPTEAEREKSARGTDGRMYPWGEQPPATELAVFRRIWGNEATDPAGIRPMGASPYGVLDMGGNVWEWCSDWYSDQYLESSPYKNPSGPEYGTKHVLRGGSWDSRPDVTSASCRNFGHSGYREGDFGFRCAMTDRSEP